MMYTCPSATSNPVLNTGSGQYGYVTVYQPDLSSTNNRDYTYRSVTKKACELITKAGSLGETGCWTVDDLKCDDGLTCLKVEEDTESGCSYPHVWCHLLGRFNKMEIKQTLGVTPALDY